MALEHTHVREQVADTLQQEPGRLLAYVPVLCWDGDSDIVERVRPRLRRVMVVLEDDAGLDANREQDRNDTGQLEAVVQRS